jgi:hypothetical protein
MIIKIKVIYKHIKIIKYHASSIFYFYSNAIFLHSSTIYLKISIIMLFCTKIVLSLNIYVSLFICLLIFLESYINFRSSGQTIIKGFFEF